jgi:hypothetical protein
VRRSLGLQSLAAFDSVFRVEDLLGASASDGALPTADNATVPAGSSLADTVLALEQHGRVAVADGAGTLARDTLDTLAFRAWLFGVLTFLEARARERLVHDREWRGVLSEARLRKAREIKDERARRGRAISTVDALQFGDVASLATRHDGWYALFGVESRRQAKQLVRRLEVLRNGLAHGQDIVSHDWETIVTVARSVIAIRLEESTAGE